jgi:hypothetical protein
MAAVWIGVIVSNLNVSIADRVAADSCRSLNGRLSLPTMVGVDMLVASAAARSLAFNGRCPLLFTLLDVDDDDESKTILLQLQDNNKKNKKKKKRKVNLTIIVVVGGVIIVTSFIILIITVIIVIVGI